MTSYRYIQEGRSVYTIAFAMLLAVLGLGMLLSGFELFVAIGGFLLAMAVSGILAFMKKEKWVIEVHDGVLKWSYARWPRSRGSIGLSSVTEMIIDDSGNWLSFTFADGSREKVKLIGSGMRFREYLKAHYPHIAIEFIEGT